MEKISVNSSYVSQVTIDACIACFDKIRHTAKPELVIQAEVELEDIDILLIAYFLLFKSLSPRLKITVILQQGQSYELIFKLRRYFVYSVLNLGIEVFDVRQMDGRPIVNINNTLNVNFIAPPKKIIPLLFITENNYKILFEGSISKLLGEISFEYLPDHKALYDKYTDFVKTKIIDIRQADSQPLQQLARYAFYNTLLNAGIFAFYYDKEYSAKKTVRPKLRFGSLIGNDAYQLYEEIRFVFDELSKKPAIYHFIYATFLASDILPAHINSGTRLDFKNGVINLWSLTQQIVTGLSELTKNIYQHTDEGIGVITGRVYRSSVWQQLKNDHAEAGELLENFVRPFRKKYKDKELGFLDLNIIDCGTKGVREKLLENSAEKNYPELLAPELKYDREQIESGHIEFSHFFDPETQVLLNQQAKRATAHMGLMTFAKTISEHDGLLRASTWLNDQATAARELALIPAKYGKPEQAPLSPMGTNYHVVIPFQPLHHNDRLSDTAADPTPIINAPVLRDIETLLKYELTETGITSSYAEFAILRLAPTKANLYNRADEALFWEQVAGEKRKSVLDEISKNKNNLIALDLENSNINASQLFRFLGKWELTHPNKALVIYNLQTFIYREFKDINELFVIKQTNQFAYWSLNSLITFYSYVRYGSNQQRFYFTDILWGKEKSDFYNVNKIVRKTSFNASCLFDEPPPHMEVFAAAKANLLTSFPIFHSGTTLMPLDLLLKSGRNISLFEHNAMVLLQKELM